MDVINGYRDRRQRDSSDEDSDDSDKECAVWKRAPVKKEDRAEIVESNDKMVEDTPADDKAVASAQPPQAVNPECPGETKPRPKRKVNNIWSEVLQDQLISEDLEDVLIKNKPRHYGSRGKESYDYTLRCIDDRIRRDSDSLLSDEAFSNDQKKQKIRHSRSARNNSKKFVKLDKAELAAAIKINKVLQEKKFYLIQRVVKIVGIEKAIQLLKMTEEIEENGGMMIQNNARRRTPGGVYIQLLKTDKDITKEMLDKIFEGEMSGMEVKKYFEERRKNKKKMFGSKFSKQKKRGPPPSVEMEDETSEDVKEEFKEKDPSPTEEVEISGGEILNCGEESMEAEVTCTDTSPA